MSKLDLEVHKLKRDREGNVFVAGINPYIRLMSAEAPYPLFIQRGRVYSETGGEVVDLPSWFEVEVAKCTTSMLASVGYLVPHNGGSLLDEIGTDKILPNKKSPLSEAVPTSNSASGTVTM